jgi:hypothetical protein
VFIPHESVLEIDRFGTFEMAVRVTAWVLRLIQNLKVPDQCVTGDLTLEECVNAKLELFKQTQGATYGTEIEALKQGRSVAKSSSLSKLSPNVGKDGLIRIGGRLDNSELSYSEKHPVILPKGHLIRSVHFKSKHAGVENMITTIRDDFWIVGLWCLAKAVKRGCVKCQRVDALACNQVAAPLPELRVHEDTGLDFAGPLYCLDFPNHKLYILLFTCAVVRAIHLELTESLRVEDCVLALRRFMARRALPTILYSDNAKTFQATEKTLLKQYGTNSPKYIVPRSPWWGGW